MSQSERLSRAPTEAWKAAFWAVRTTRSKVDRTFDVTGTVHWGLGGRAGRGQVLMAAVTCIGPQAEGSHAGGCFGEEER